MEIIDYYQSCTVRDKATWFNSDEEREKTERQILQLTSDFQYHLADALTMTSTGYVSLREHTKVIRNCS